MKTEGVAFSPNGLYVAAGVAVRDLTLERASIATLSYFRFPMALSFASMKTETTWGFRDPGFRRAAKSLGPAIRTITTTAARYSFGMS
jgi:hypothetical protein